MYKQLLCTTSVKQCYMFLTESFISYFNNANIVHERGLSQNKPDYRILKWQIKPPDTALFISNGMVILNP